MSAIYTPARGQAARSTSGDGLHFLSEVWNGEAVFLLWLHEEHHKWSFPAERLWPDVVFRGVDAALHELGE